MHILNYDLRGSFVTPGTDDVEGEEGNSLRLGTQPPKLQIKTVDLAGIRERK